MVLFIKGEKSNLGHCQEKMEPISPTLEGHLIPFVASAATIGSKLLNSYPQYSSCMKGNDTRLF